MFKIYFSQFFHFAILAGIKRILSSVNTAYIKQWFSLIIMSTKNGALDSFKRYSLLISLGIAFSALIVQNMLIILYQLLISV